ncbi:hypothetical protein G6O69_05390 [Pseudenhygromyxa sp. WMMC2535]|uniref:hypothetical protein n=1 Tax=Pseudenhygromyxa sp. WMMC2535 TaxID=2712867 RepID=UPI00159562A3|nr:hypothetical protein [Pseudenhygromyxa sp. WMMC2535]NVB37254.1 hypothetical protein [Pseudenhygromyxa sp. WMMC2535]
MAGEHLGPDGATQRFIYDVEQGTWRQMVAELLHEATFDADTLGEASSRLGLSVSELETWMRWVRGPLDGIQPAYLVPMGSWSEMRDGLLLSIVTDAGSMRKAARSVNVPRSTLGHWVRRARRR